MSKDNKLHADKSGGGLDGGAPEGQSGSRSSSRRRRRSQRNRKRGSGEQQQAQNQQQQNQPQGQQPKQQPNQASGKPQHQSRQGRSRKQHGGRPGDSGKNQPQQTSPAAREDRTELESPFAARNSKANMIVLVDSDQAYVEMESLAVVNYVSGFNPMGFTALDKALSYVTSPRNEGRIRMVLLSLEIADQDGVSVEDLLEAMRGHGEVPLVAVSEQNCAERVEHVLSLGAVGFLPKAFTMDVFVRFVKDVLRKGHVTGWQCSQCGKLVPMDQVDMLNMRPIRCVHRDCVSPEIQEVTFGESQPEEVKAG